MTSYPRESWQDPQNPITGPKPKAKRTTGVLHYSGSNSIPGDKPAWLRSMQNDYTKNRGYSLGYGYLVTGNGDDYEIRGADFNNAANNGDKVSGNANDWTLSILLDVTTTSAATPAQIATCRRIFADAGIIIRPVPHSFYDYTSCCGATVTGQINAGLFDPTSAPDPIPTPSPPLEDDDMYLATLSNGDVVVVGSAVRPVSPDELTGPFADLERCTPSPSSYWHQWLRAGADEYARRIGM